MAVNMQKPEIKKIEQHAVDLCVNIADYLDLENVRNLGVFVINQLNYFYTNSKYLLRNQDETIAGLIYIWFKLYGLDFGRNATPNDISKICNIKKLEVHEIYKQVLENLPKYIRDEWDENYGDGYKIIIPKHEPPKKEITEPVKETPEEKIPRAYLEIQRIATNLGLSKEVIDQAFELYKNGVGKIRGKPTAAAAATIYIAKKELNQDISLENLVNTTYMNIKGEEGYENAQRKIISSCTLICENLNLKQYLETEQVPEKKRRGRPKKEEGNVPITPGKKRRGRPRKEKKRKT